MSSLAVEFGPVSAPITNSIQGVQIPTATAGKPFEFRVHPSLKLMPILPREVEQLDYVFIELTSAISGSKLTSIPLAKPLFGEKVFLPAFHEPTWLEQKARDSGIRQQVAGFCQIIQPQLAGCMTHACSTTPGASGAPMFVERSLGGRQELMFIGIHTSGKREETFCPGDAAADTILNYGVVVRAEDVARLE
ncbi:MAG: hypothetical protein KF892_08510 [Rhizobacter sp.]|nr:hypothetical protein [Rhizobacter sp.]